MGIEMMGIKDPREVLADKKLAEASDAIQKEKEKQVIKRLAEFANTGLLYSSPLRNSRVIIELDTLRNLLIDKLQIDRDVFFKTKPPSTEEDESFLKKRIEILFKGAMRRAEQSLVDFKSRYRYPERLDDFQRKANEILAEMKRKIEIIVLENKISFPTLADIDIDSLIITGESDQIEFKSTFQWDVKEQKKNKELRHEVIKTLAAYSNSNGGYLLIGVEDNGNIFGL